MRLLAVFVAWFSFGQFLSALLLLGPHSDLPGQPAFSFVAFAAALGGAALARALWRRRASAARGLPLWGAGMIGWIIALALSTASPAERREGAPALAIGLPLWVGLIALATRYVRRRGAPAA